MRFTKRKIPKSSIRKVLFKASKELWKVNMNAKYYYEVRVDPKTGLSKLTKNIL